jgi:hypothetical protein
MADFASPSPTGLLLVLGLVFFIWAASITSTVDSTASESVRYVKSVHTFPLEPLILIPVIFPILLQLYASYEGSTKLKMPELILAIFFCSRRHGGFVDRAYLEAVSSAGFLALFMI